VTCLSFLPYRQSDNSKHTRHGLYIADRFLKNSDDHATFYATGARSLPLRDRSGVHEPRNLTVEKVSLIVLFKSKYQNARVRLGSLIIMMSLRDRQINALKQMLNLNQPEPRLEDAVPTWKILIYDRLGQDIISPLISVKELREHGVTLHMQLHSDRDSIPEVPAIYFCAPTDENLGRIGQDLQNGLYDIYHLNFISPISRQKMEDLAAAAARTWCSYTRKRKWGKKTGPPTRVS